MGRKKITNLFPDYIRTGNTDHAELSPLVLLAKGGRSMNDFAKDCEVNTSTISRIINMKNTTACSDEVLISISKAADPSSGVTLDKLLAANGMVKMVPTTEEGAVVSPIQITYSVADDKKPKRFLEYASALGDTFKSMETRYAEGSRETLQNALLLAGYSVELLGHEKIIWPRNKQFYADFAIWTNALQDEGIDMWLFDCKSYTTGIGRGTISSMNRLFGMAYLDSPREHGIKVSIVVNHSLMIEQARECFAGYKIRDFFSFILVDPLERKVLDEFCIPRIDGTEQSVFKTKDRR